MARQAWLFQAVPQRFDFDGFLGSGATECLWLAQQCADEMAPGDAVFLWRGVGIPRHPEWAGVVGHAVIAGAVFDTEDNSPSRFYWRDPTDAVAIVPRVPIRIAEMRRHPLEYDELKSDPALKAMSIFRQAQGSNFPITAVEARYIERLWRGS